MASSKADVGRATRTRKEVSVLEVFIFVVVVILWIAFAVALFGSGSTVEQVWEWLRQQPLGFQVPLFILFLPWIAATWVWQTAWPLLAKAVLVIGMAWATIYAFLPWKPIG